MRSIQQTYTIAASPADVWRALTEPEMIRKWSGAAAHFPLEVGSKYALWNGEILGEIVAFEANRRLAQTWKPQNWTTQNSVVTFTLMPTSNGTRVELLHENVEDSDYA